MKLLQPPEVILATNLAVSVNPKAYNKLWEYRGNPSAKLRAIATSEVEWDAVETTRERLK